MLGARRTVREYRRISLPARAIAEAILYAVSQPEGVDVNELTVRPSKDAAEPGPTAFRTQRTPGRISIRPGVLCRDVCQGKRRGCSMLYCPGINLPLVRALWYGTGG